MEQNDNFIALVEAQMYAYFALVNSLKQTAGFDDEPLKLRLSAYANMLDEDHKTVTADFLRAYLTSLSGQPLDTESIRKLLH